MKISFVQNYEKSDSSSLQNQIRNDIQKSLEDLGTMEFYIGKLDSIILGINNALNYIATQQNADTLHLERKIIDLELGESSRIDLIEAIEECVDIALDRSVHNSTLERISEATMETINNIALKQNKDLIKVDPYQELQAIIEHIEERWDGFDKVDISAFFTKIWDMSMNFSKYGIDKYMGMELYQEWKNERKDYSTWDRAGTKLTKEEVRIYKYHDFISNFVDSLISAPNDFYNIVMEKWDYTKHKDSIIKEVKTSFPFATKLRPKGWKALAKNYSDYDGQEEYCNTQQAIDDAAFKGIDSGSAGGFPFQGRVALPYVMYDDKCQGRKPLEVLVGAVLAHALAVNIHNNQAIILEELSNLKEQLSGSQYYQDIVLNVDIESNLKSPIMKGIYAVMTNHITITSESEFKEMVHNDREEAKKPKDNTPKEPFDMAAFMKEIMSKEKDPAEIAKEKEEKKLLSEKVWAVLESGENTKAAKPKMK